MVYEAPPSGFLEGSVYRDTVFIGSNSTIKIGDKPTPEGGSEYGIYTSPRKRYAKLYGQNLYELFINIKNPLFVEGKYEVSAKDLSKEDALKLKQKGYDSIVVSNSKNIKDASEVVLFDSNQAHVFKGYR